MADHYSTVSQTEVRASIAKVIDLANVRNIVLAAAHPEGVHEGLHDPGNRKAG